MTGTLRAELDYQQLDKELDRVKSKVFLSKNAAFLGHLLCSMNFVWTEDIETACTNGISIYWNPYWFLSLPPATRLTVLVHELWHPALLHMLRVGTRAPKIWNWAADIVINNMLDAEGYSFEGTHPWLDRQYDGQATEDVYDALIAQFQTTPGKLWGHVNPLSGQGDETDLVEQGSGDDNQMTPAEEHTIINNVVAASHAAGLSGHQAGQLPGEVETVLKRFLQPKLPWEQLLYAFFNERSGQDFSWSRPNRRYQDVYLPSLQDDDQGLTHVIYYLDVSGSVSDGEVVRFNSEVKYVMETFRPEKLTMVQFDTRIQKEQIFEQDEPFDEMVVVGRGGTSLVCVRDHIIQNRPSAVVVFSDLCCSPMEPLPPGHEVPMIWVGVNAHANSSVPHGQLVHIRE